jgi:hypothetical protein
LALNFPWIVSPLEAIDSTESPFTCSRKYGLNGTVTRGSPTEGRKNSSDSQFSATSTSTKYQKPRIRCGGGPVGACSGIPRPSGEGETCQPRLSRGSGGCGSLRSIRSALRPSDSLAA